MMRKDNKQIDELGKTLEVGSSTIKEVDGFFEKILVGILNCIFSILWHIPVWLWKILKYIAVKIFKNFGRIWKFIYRLTKLAVILAILAGIVVWPIIFGVPFLILWCVFVVIPGIWLGFRIWKKKVAEAKLREQEDNDASISVIEPYIERDQL